MGSSSSSSSLCSFAVILQTFLVFQSGHAQQPWTWTCVNDAFCERTPTTAGVTGTSMDVCKLNCGPYGSLLPFPTGATSIGKTLVGFYPQNVSITGFETFPEQTRNMSVEAAKIFTDYLHSMNNEPWQDFDPAYSNNALIVEINVADPNVATITLGLDEAYNLTISTLNTRVTARISAVNFFGARHGLETLNQLIAFDEDHTVLQIVAEASIIEDKPVYTYRGVHIDTARNFFSLQALKRLVDGMSYNKLNILHWHLSDTNSFPFEVTGRPQFTTYGTHTKSKIYSLQDTRDLVQYAQIRGVKVVPEFDQPAHNGFGWQWGEQEGLGELVLCLNEKPFDQYCYQPPCGLLNIVNENVTTLFGEIFESMLSVFDNDLFHLGGDEVMMTCYNKSDSPVASWMEQNGYDRDPPGFMRLWGWFQEKAHAKLVAASDDPNIQTIMWTSELTSKEYFGYLNKSHYIIQIWSNASDVDDDTIPDLINAGYKTIFTNVDALYLDCGFPAWIGNGHNWCSPYKGWQTIYENSPYRIYADRTNSTAADEAYNAGLLLGASTALWAEQADELSFESRIFPRVSALAERLWSDPMETGWYEAEVRMVTNRQRLAQRGLGPDRMQPEFCSQYQNHCGTGPREPEPTTTTTTTTTSTTTTTTGQTSPVTTTSTVPPPEATTDSAKRIITERHNVLLLAVMMIAWFHF